MTSAGRKEAEDAGRLEGKVDLPAVEARAEFRQEDQRAQDPERERPFQPWGTWILHMQLPQPPAAPWVPRVVGYPVTGDRLIRVEPGPLVP